MMNLNDLLSLIDKVTIINSGKGNTDAVHGGTHQPFLWSCQSQQIHRPGGAIHLFFSTPLI
ncbi:MAG: hypothetical protein A2Y12_20715 [Planctomycetes bacterium GWF2_42_9]|nr:MAG: hypothetical protein A2Y12_20715 [Planctomycetes bacterium GWF2_42_9]